MERSDRMKPKRVVIFYAKQFFGSMARAERVFVDVIKQMEKEGREVKYINEDMAMFKDGTKVDKVPFGRGLLGLRVTHCYIDRYALTIEHSKNFIMEAVLPMIVEGDYKHLDVEDKAIDRLMVFDNHNVEKYEKYS
jgi:hypothetical protein